MDAFHQEYLGVLFLFLSTIEIRQIYPNPKALKYILLGFFLLKRYTSASILRLEGSFSWWMLVSLKIKHLSNGFKKEIFISNTFNWFFFYYVISQYPHTFFGSFLAKSMHPKIWVVKAQTSRHIPTFDIHTQTHAT